MLSDEVERPLDGPLPAREDGRPQLEERRPLSRHVLAALHEQLGRVGREADLDSLAVRLLDDLEDGALVEVGLREDDLVGTRLVEDERELGPRAQEPEPRDRPPARRRRRTRSVSPLRALVSELLSRVRLSPAPTSTTRRLIPAARMTSRDADSYAARRSPMVTAEATTDVGMSPEVVKS